MPSRSPDLIDYHLDFLFFRWYPPGHGDFYQSFYNSGLLDELIDQGKTICFMSNIDNMGATVDLGILSECMKDDAQFFMEVTDKTRADVKGGTLIQYEGKLRLLEVAQVSKIVSNTYLVINVCCYFSLP